MDIKKQIAFRAAKEFKDGDFVNLGIGLPTMIPHYLDPSVSITLHSENGFVRLGPLEGEPIPNLVNAGGQPCGILPGGAYFDSAMSFLIVRGGHLDITVLGGLQVDQHGNLANWMVPGKMVPGMGGAMDLVTGAKSVIVTMEHTAKDGSGKILEQCTLPLTAKGKVSKIITEHAYFEFKDGKLWLKELSPVITLEQLKAITPAQYEIHPELKPLELVT